MYDYINGIIAYKSLEYVSIDVNGLAYMIYIPFKTYEKLANEQEKDKLYLYLHISENDQKLYGFKDKIEREIFKKIISVSGIGPKIGISILSVFSPEELAGIMELSDDKRLSQVPGLGIKKAQKMIIELKDKLTNIKSDVSGFEIAIIKEELKMALEQLGYTKIKITQYITEEEILQIKDSGKLMTMILKKLSK